MTMNVTAEFNEFKKRIADINNSENINWLREKKKEIDTTIENLEESFHSNAFDDDNARDIKAAGDLKLAIFNHVETLPDEVKVTYELL